LKRFGLSRAAERGHVPLVVLAGSRSSEIPLVVITMELAVELAAGVPGRRSVARTISSMGATAPLRWRAGAKRLPQLDKRKSLSTRL
jgi:hypothetical protein